MSRSSAKERSKQALRSAYDTTRHVASSRDSSSTCPAPATPLHTPPRAHAVAAGHLLGHADVELVEVLEHRPEVHHGPPVRLVGVEHHVPEQLEQVPAPTPTGASPPALSAPSPSSTHDVRRTAGRPVLPTSRRCRLAQPRDTGAAKAPFRGYSRISANLR